MPRESLLITTLVELADTLVDDFDVIDVLTMLCNRCVDVLDVDAAGVMLAAPGGSLQFIASSNESMRILELFQLQMNEGPCVDCFTMDMTIVNHHLDIDDGRWRFFTPQALDLGFDALHCFPMRHRGQTVGALNLLSTDRTLMNADDMVVAKGLVDIATIAILQHRIAIDAHRLNDQLSIALNSRIVIEQAKGMVSQSLSCGMDEAFARLRAHGRNHNLRLTELARSVVEGEVTPRALDAAGGSGRTHR